jgi:hypothetical protein
MNPTITRAASTAPATVDEATRSVDLVIATDSPVNGLVLICTRAAVSTADAPVPVLLSHENNTRAMAGRLGPVRFEGGKLLARAYFTDAPAADEGWQLARAGCAVSVGASYAESDVSLQGSVEVVRRWRLVEASLVPAGADPAGLTRIFPPLPPHPRTMETESQTIDANISAIDTESGEQQLSRAELSRQLTITRAANFAGLQPEEIERIINETAGHPATVGLTAVVRAARLAAEAKSPVAAGHPARIEVTNEPQGIQAVLTRAIKGERLSEPLWLSLRNAGIGKGNDPVSVWRSALSGEGRTHWVSRGMLTTDDLPALLTETGNRQLMERFAIAEAGVRVAASVRPLDDYREAGVIDVGMVGSAKVINESGEITFGYISESSAKYKPRRHGIGISLSPESLANDDLNGLDEALSELAATMLDAEALALADLLEGAALGRNAPDGKALFHADHANVVGTGPLSITALGSAVERLRNQRTLSGRHLDQAPAALLVGTAQETLARQLLSDAINAAQASNVNPWKNLSIEVDPRLSGSFAYLLGNSRKPLELGRLTEAPVLTTEVQFSTDNYRAKSTHAFGCIVKEHRSIIRIATT